MRLTLEGEYGARTSFRDPDKTQEDDEKIMVIAAPIRFQTGATVDAEAEVVGVVSVVKPVRSLEQFLEDESQQLKQYVIGLIALAVLLSFLVSQWFTAATNKLANYANDMAEGKKVPLPRFLDHRFTNLAAAISHLREQVDGKTYVENYVHSLTHELKTPITAVQANAELLEEEVPAAHRQRFISNIQSANNRMSKLVDRMLSLAKLEGMPASRAQERFNLSQAVEQLLTERGNRISQRGVNVVLRCDKSRMAYGDPLLIQQAIGNLLDNALEFCPAGGEIKISCNIEPHRYRVEVANDGETLDQFVLDQAFDRFFSLPREKGSAKSTGLGLSFVREIMALHQGEAKITNREGDNNKNSVVATLSWPRRNTTSVV